jgi:DNA invertase Pin-like site-specific DNA recombinase
MEVVVELVVEGQSRSIIDPGEAKAAIHAYAELARLAEARAFDFLIHRNADRLARTRTLVAWCQETCEANGILCWNLEASAKPPDCPDPLLDAVRGGMAKRETGEQKRRWHDGMVARAERGMHSGNVPMAYRKMREKVHGQREDREWIEVVPEEADAVRRAFEEFAAGRSLRSVADELGMSHKGFRRLVANPFYVGRVRMRLKPNVLWSENTIEVEGNHEPIIDPELFERVQVRLAHRAAENKRQPYVRHVVTGITVCGYCGSNVPMKHGRGKLRYLICPTPDCRRPDGHHNRVRYEVAVLAVEKLLRSELPSAREVLEAAFPAGMADQRAQAEAEVKAARRRLTDATKKAQRWATAFERGELTAAALRERWAEAEARLAEAEAALAAAESRFAGLPSEAEAEARLKRLAARAGEIADRLLTDDPQEAMRLKTELREAGVRATIYQEGVAASLAWPM